MTALVPIIRRYPSKIIYPQRTVIKIRFHLPRRGRGGKSGLPRRHKPTMHYYLTRPRIIATIIIIMMRMNWNNQPRRIGNPSKPPRRPWPPPAPVRRQRPSRPFLVDDSMEIWPYGYKYPSPPLPPSHRIERVIVITITILQVVVRTILILIIVRQRRRPCPHYSPNKHRLLDRRHCENGK